MRIFLGAFGDPGHAFPVLALARALSGRGHHVHVETWKKWREDVLATGASFSPAPEYQVFPTTERPLKPYEAAARAALETREVVAAGNFDVAVHDILTTAASLAAELAGVPAATLIPHVHPYMPPGCPPYSIGARRPRTRLGARAWSLFDPVIERGLVTGRDQLNGCRARLGLPARDYLHAGLSRELTLVGTLPELEYPRDWQPHEHVVGPLMWEPPGERVDPPAGTGPVVLIAPSTSQDPSHLLLRASLAGLADAPVRVIATYNGREPSPPVPVPSNAVLVPWLSYSRTMPACDLVVCHGGHGTVVRALTNGVPVLICPAAGDMAENAARCDWAGVGVRLPLRLLGPRTLRLAVERALGRPSIRARAREIAAAAPDGAVRAAEQLERWAAARAQAANTTARPAGRT